MRLRHNHIFFFLIFLSLSGYGSDLSGSGINVKYLKETEWIARPAIDGKISKCIRFHFKSFIRSEDLSVHLWEKLFRNTYDRKITIILINRTTTFRDIKTEIEPASGRKYTPRLFTNDHKGSFLKAEPFTQFCCINGLTPIQGNSMWKHLLNREWIIQKRKTNIKKEDVSDGYLTGCSSFWPHQ